MPGLLPRGQVVDPAGRWDYARVDPAGRWIPLGAELTPGSWEHAGGGLEPGGPMHSAHALAAQSGGAIGERPSVDDPGHRRLQPPVCSGAGALLTEGWPRAQRGGD